MRDDQLAHLLREADEPAYPSAAFADRLFEQLSREGGASRGSRVALLLVAAVMVTTLLAVGAGLAGGLIKLPWLSAVTVTPAPTAQPTAQPTASESAMTSEAPATAIPTPSPPSPRPSQQRGS